jgi:hypothetical protein
MAVRTVRIWADRADPDPVKAFKENPGEGGQPDRIQWVPGDTGQYTIRFRGRSPVNGSAFAVPTGPLEVTGERRKYSYDIMSSPMAGPATVLADPDVDVE